MQEFQMTRSKWSGQFRLVACGSDGVPSEDLGELPDVIRETCEATVALYRRVGFIRPWIGYLAVHDDRVVGGGAFVGPPTDGKVEIAYFTLPDYEGKGMASRTASELVRLARGADRSIAVFAKTFPKANASTMILENLGFRNIGSVTDDEIGEAWAWLLTPLPN
jgi:GNAT superfamily N-acetyltransferase